MAFFSNPSTEFPGLAIYAISTVIQTVLDLVGCLDQEAYLTTLQPGQLGNLSLLWFPHS
jgi:hypothetical protein